MTPNTFEGYTLAGKFGSLSYFAGYLDKMKTRNDDKFRDFATVAGAPTGVSEGMWLGGVTFAFTSASSCAFLRIASRTCSLRPTPMGSGACRSAQEWSFV